MVNANGTPSIIHTNNGGEFKSLLLKDYCEKNITANIFCGAHYPQRSAEKTYRGIELGSTYKLLDNKKNQMIFR